MASKVSIKKVYRISEDLVARDLQGEFIIIPISSDVAGGADDFFSLNPTGRAVWDKIDGKKTLGEIVGELGTEFKAAAADIEKDCLGFLQELLKRKMLVEVRK